MIEILVFIRKLLIVCDIDLFLTPDQKTAQEFFLATSEPAISHLARSIAGGTFNAPVASHGTLVVINPDIPLPPSIRPKRTFTHVCLYMNLFGFVFARRQSVISFKTSEAVVRLSASRDQLVVTAYVEVLAGRQDSDPVNAVPIVFTGEACEVVVQLMASRDQLAVIAVHAEEFIGRLGFDPENSVALGNNVEACEVVVRLIASRDQLGVIAAYVEVLTGGFDFDPDRNLVGPVGLIDLLGLASLADIEYASSGSQDPKC